MIIYLQPIATVRNSRMEPIDDNWEAIIADIELAEHVATEALENISDFSHLEIIYYFNKVKDEDVVFPGGPAEIQTIPWSEFSVNARNAGLTKSDSLPLNFYTTVAEC